MSMAPATTLNPAQLDRLSIITIRFLWPVKRLASVASFIDDVTRQLED
jgi:hypothetical protein